MPPNAFRRVQRISLKPREVILLRVVLWMNNREILILMNDWRNILTSIVMIVIDDYIVQPFWFRKTSGQASLNFLLLSSQRRFPMETYFRLLKKLTDWTQIFKTFEKCFGVRKTLWSESLLQIFEFPVMVKITFQTRTFNPEISTVIYFTMHIFMMHKKIKKKRKTFED